MVAGDVIAGAKVVVCQMEIPRAATIQALQLGRDAGVTTIFNPAPAVADLEDEFFQVRHPPSQAMCKLPTLPMHLPSLQPLPCRTLDGCYCSWQTCSVRTKRRRR